MTVHIAGRGPEVLGVYSLFTALTTITIILRIYCRAFASKHRALGWDDTLALLAWIFFVLFAVFAMTGVHHGTGQHAWNIKPETEIPVGLKWWWLCEPAYVVSNMAIKGSIAVMLLRLTVLPTHRIIIWVTFAITEIFSLAFLVYFICQCLPPQYFWTRYTGGEGTCVDPEITVNLVYAYSAILCVGDWTYAILPCILVWDLQMPRTQKMFVGLILAMGAIASIATIIRIPYVQDLSNVDDFLYATTDVAVWSCCETGLGITAACCATLRPLFRSRFSGSAFERSAGGTATVGSHGRKISTPLGAGSHTTYQGGHSGYSVRVQGKSERDAYGDTRDEMELRQIPKGNILVEQCDSASVESTPSNSSTTKIVHQ